ncbi:MAG TPA: hypothetical protein VLH40_03405 [Atribacteraceae bacterium]|nr:hypothetical protein [Atribacteraceae bacterium]
MRMKSPAQIDIPDLSSISRDLSEWDQETYLKIVSTHLTLEQVEWIIAPPRIYPEQEHVLAIHWHPEYVPLDLIERRITTMFPNRKNELVIPTQHNIPLDYHEYTGVEVDCFSREFNRKVQLLFHFETAKLKSPRADVFKAMLQHTFQYRSSQLYDFIDTILEPSREDRLHQVAGETGANDELIGFVRLYISKLKRLIDSNRSVTPAEMIKNKLIRDWFDELRELYDDRLINRAQVFLKVVKEVVKAHFTLDYFYQTKEVIEEGRSLGAGIVIPHPEQFWPILLADYDVDGYEVWNPQSREFTEFFINVVNRRNKSREGWERSVLVFMGDDTHMSEKARNPILQDREKVGREIGLQEAWDDLAIRKSLIVANSDRPRIIREYKNRLRG